MVAPPCYAGYRPGRFELMPAPCSSGSSSSWGITCGASVMPLLTLLWAVPLAGAILLLLIPGGGDEPARPADDHEVRGSRGPRDSLFRNLTLVISVVVFGLTLLLW